MQPVVRARGAPPRAERSQSMMAAACTANAPVLTEDTDSTAGADLNLHRRTLTGCHGHGVVVDPGDGNYVHDDVRRRRRRPVDVVRRLRRRDRLVRGVAPALRLRLARAGRGERQVRRRRDRGLRPGRLRRERGGHADHRCRRRRSRSAVRRVERRLERSHRGHGRRGATRRRRSARAAGGRRVAARAAAAGQRPAAAAPAPTALGDARSRRRRRHVRAGRRPTATGTAASNGAWVARSSSSELHRRPTAYCASATLGRSVPAAHLRAVGVERAPGSSATARAGSRRSTRRPRPARSATARRGTRSNLAVYGNVAASRTIPPRARPHRARGRASRPPDHRAHRPRTVVDR